MTDIVERLRTWLGICSDAAWDDLSEAADEIERLRAEHAVHLRVRAALVNVLDTIADYERVNNLCPNPGRKYCWDCVAQAHEVLETPLTNG